MKRNFRQKDRISATGSENQLTNIIFFFIHFSLSVISGYLSHVCSNFSFLSRRISEFFSTFHKITRFRSDSDIFIRTLLYDVHLLLSLTVLSIFFYINLLLTINSVDELEKKK